MPWFPKEDGAGRGSLQKVKRSSSTAAQPQLHCVCSLCAVCCCRTFGKRSSISEVLRCNSCAV